MIGLHGEIGLLYKQGPSVSNLSTPSSILRRRPLKISIMIVDESIIDYMMSIMSMEGDLEGDLESMTLSMLIV